jgi:hypothetical protein
MTVNRAIEKLQKLQAEGEGNRQVFILNDEYGIMYEPRFLKAEDSPEFEEELDKFWGKAREHLGLEWKEIIIV